MSNSEAFANTDVKVHIDQAIRNVRDYPHYGTSQDVIRHFEQLDKECPRGVSVEIDQVATQEAPDDGRLVPLIKTAVDLGDSGGETLYAKRDVHGEEQAGQLFTRELGTLAVRNPELFRMLGIDRVVFFGANPARADMNTWQLQSLQLRSYLRGARRGWEQPDWDYPVNHPAHHHESTVPGCIASQQIIKEENPRLLVSLHNGILGSYHGYVMNPPEGLPEELAAFMKRLYNDFPAAPRDPMYAPTLAEGIYRMPSWAESYDHYAAQQSPDAPYVPQGGTISLDYAAAVAKQANREPTTGIVMEPAYFLNHRLTDSSPSGLTHAQAMAKSVAHAQAVVDTTNRYFEKVSKGDDDNFLAKDIRSYVDYWSQALNIARNNTPPESTRQLTGREAVVVANSFSPYVALPLGMLSVLAEQRQSPYQAQINEHLDNEVAYLKDLFKPTIEPPRRLAQATMGATLISSLAIVRAA